MSTTDRPQDVLVIGAGMVGLATAWFLQEAGAQVRVIDRENVAAGSSWGNAGWLAPALTLPLPEPAVLAVGLKALVDPASALYVPFRLDPGLWRFLIGFARHCTPGKWREAMSVYDELNARSLAAYDELTAADVSEPTHESDPFIVGFTDESHRSDFVAELQRVRTSGGEEVFEIVDGDRLSSLQPVLSENVRFGVRLFGQRFINPGRFAHALADAVRARGGMIIGDRPITAVERSGRQVAAFDGREEVARADAAVIATGTWLPKLARRHGVRQRVQAGRGYSFTVYPDAGVSAPMYFPYQRIACTPLGGETDGLRVAGMMEFRGADEPLDPRRIQAVIGATAPMFTGVDFESRSNEWVGPRPCTPDGLPLIGPTRTEGIYVAGGHGMWGVTLGPLTGKLLTDQIMKRTPDPILSRLDPLR